MTVLPIRQLTVTDFRRLNGTRVLPLDAPVVLIHGPNGTGKTSVLSALELALTGTVRSMELQSDNYLAHLPFLGRRQATVQADVAADLRAETPEHAVSVSMAGVDGDAAFRADIARFYAERCYLDQASLGRLLDIYQAREGKKESALEKFVNELLGLEKLDALRDGLNDASDFRLFKKTSPGVDEADRQAKFLASQCKEQALVYTKTRRNLETARSMTEEAVLGLDLRETTGLSDAEFLRSIRLMLNDERTKAEFAEAKRLLQEVIALGGRISGLAGRPSARRIAEIQDARRTVTAELNEWKRNEEPRILAWEQRARESGVDLRDGLLVAVEATAERVLEELDSYELARKQAASLAAGLDEERQGLNKLERRLHDAHQFSSALVEGLVALRGIVSANNNCPVCDRDFAEVDSSHSLQTHLDRKLNQLAKHGEQLVSLRAQRDQISARLQKLEAEQLRSASRIPTVEQQRLLESRHAALLALTLEAEQIEIVKSRGDDLERYLRETNRALEDFEEVAAEEDHVRRELVRYAALLDRDRDQEPKRDVRKSAEELMAIAEARVGRYEDEVRLRRKLGVEADRLELTLNNERASAEILSDLTADKMRWDRRVADAKVRQGVAKEVHGAAALARSNIVTRVFTDTLNQVWKTVFTRLAPTEGFIPSFRIPNRAAKKFEIKLETTHRNGESGGSPQIMLSAGNLNTAALSLFLALHLAVEPLVPCLVLDDPVQAMDEVHVAQFAALIRTLSKTNGRQVIIAVHERELFDYLTLELSPAFQGDELLTIELGERADDDDEGVTRYQWVPDTAIAI